MDHSFEEIRAVALDLLAGREKGSYGLSQYGHLLIGVAEVLERRGERGVERGAPSILSGDSARLSGHDRELFLEVFWSLFRDGIITIGLDDANRNFPFFRLTQFGRRIADHQQAYFFHDVSSYEKVVKAEVPDIDEVTLLYLKEAMQSFRSGCVLAATVMLGVATEHLFLQLIERIEQNPTHSQIFASVGPHRTILQKVNKFKNILDQHVSELPPEVRGDLDTQFVGVLSIIRTFRNQAGHPTGKIVDREQAYVLLQLFVPYCKKIYQLMEHFSRSR